MPGDTNVRFQRAPQGEIGKEAALKPSAGTVSEPALNNQYGMLLQWAQFPLE